MRRRGFTLVELLIVVAVLSLIALAAVPSWQRHVRRVNRVEAIVALHALLAAQERGYLAAGRYTSNITAAPPAGLGMSQFTENARYALSVSVSEDGQSFIATATPTFEGGQLADADCLAFSIDHRGRRAVSGSAEVRDCWR